MRIHFARRRRCQGSAIAEVLTVAAVVGIAWAVFAPGVDGWTIFASAHFLQVWIAVVVGVVVTASIVAARVSPIHRKWLAAIGFSLWGLAFCVATVLIIL